MQFNIGCHKLEVRGLDSPLGHWLFAVDLILLATLRPWSRLCLYQKWLPGIFRGGKEASQGVRLTTSLSSVSLLSKRCGSLDVSKNYGTSRPVTDIALLFPFYLARCLVRISEGTSATMTFPEENYWKNSKIRLPLLLFKLIFVSDPSIGLWMVWLFKASADKPQASTRNWKRCNHCCLLRSDTMQSGSLVHVF
jgi:hypothetical protein